MKEKRQGIMILGKMDCESGIQNSDVKGYEDSKRYWNVEFSRRDNKDEE